MSFMYTLICTTSAPEGDWTVLVVTTGVSGAAGEDACAHPHGLAAVGTGFTDGGRITMACSIGAARPVPGFEGMIRSSISG